MLSATRSILPSEHVPNLSLPNKRKDLVAMYVQIFFLKCMVQAWQKFGEEIRIQAAESKRVHRHRQIDQTAIRHVEEASNYRRIEQTSKSEGSLPTTSYLQACLVVSTPA